MIASLTGTVQTIHPNSVVLDVNGVGYLVNVTPALSASLQLGEGLLVQTAMIVREDAMTLFGFTDVEQLNLFELLRSVSGVGPKSALAIVSALSSDQIFDAVSAEDDLVFKSVPGIGPKTAKLIVVTLAGKVTLSGSKKQVLYLVFAPGALVYAAAAAFFAAFLNAVFNYCLGCQIYFGLKRLRVIR